MSCALGLIFMFLPCFVSYNSQILGILEGYRMAGRHMVCKHHLHNQDVQRLTEHTSSLFLIDNEFLGFLRPSASQRPRETNFSCSWEADFMASGPSIMSSLPFHTLSGLSQFWAVGLSVVDLHIFTTFRELQFIYFKHFWDFDIGRVQEVMDALFRQPRCPLADKTFFLPVLTPK
jgi:hypothetical protein